MGVARQSKVGDERYSTHRGTACTVLSVSLNRRKGGCTAQKQAGRLEGRLSQGA